MVSTIFLSSTYYGKGMVMAINILADTTRIQVAAGYESGHTMVYVQNDPGATFQKLYSAQPHTQPGQLLPSMIGSRAVY